MAGGEPRPIVGLVVDDEPEIRHMLIDILQDEGFVAHAAADTATGLAAIDDVAPDVVLLDVWMPSMNGLDMLTEIRKRGELAVILVTGRGGETDRVVGLRMGADD